MENQTIIRWGILGAGIIAHKMAEALSIDPGSELVAVASRTPEKAQSFAQQYQIRSSSYEALVAAADIDVVYIATTHNLHCENARLVLGQGKHALIEKPFTVNASQARELVQLASDNGCFLMEAIWTRFLPSMIRLKQLIAAGKIGTPIHFDISFGGMIPQQFQHRLSAIELAGGATLDLGIYPISFLCFNLGETPDEIRALGRISESGVDELACYQFRFPSGCTASVTTSFNLVMKSKGMIYGDQGYIELRNFQTAEHLALVHHGGTNEQRTGEEMLTENHANGFIYQVAEVVSCLNAGKLESDVIPLDESVSIMQVMDEIRRQLGVQYPFE